MVGGRAGVGAGVGANLSCSQRSRRIPSVPPHGHGGYLSWPCFNGPAWRRIPIAQVVALALFLRVEGGEVGLGEQPALKKNKKKSYF